MIVKGLHILPWDVTFTAMNSCALLVCKLEHVFFGRRVWETVTLEAWLPSGLSNLL